MIIYSNASQHIFSKVIKVAVSDYDKTIYTILTRGLEMRSIEKEGRCLAFTSTTKHEIRQFHVVVVQQRQRNWMYRKALCTLCGVIVLLI